MRELPYVLTILLAFVPFLLLLLLSAKLNLSKTLRVRQMFLLPAALVYCVGMFLLCNRLSQILIDLVVLLADQLSAAGNQEVAELIRSIALQWGTILALVLFNTVALLVFVVIKGILNLIFKRLPIQEESIREDLAKQVYTYDEEDNTWYVRPQLGQARTFLKVAYWCVVVVSVAVMLISCMMLRKGSVLTPFYPVFAVVLLGELYFLVDGLCKGEQSGSLTVEADQSRHMAMYPLLRNPLRALLGDKLSAEGTTVNNGSFSGGSAEEILVGIETEGGHLGRNYAAFLRRKMDGGIKPNVDYIRSGYDLAAGKSLLFNTPFYYKLNPYVFYAMNRHLLTGGKVLLVLGRHGTEADLQRWCRNCMQEFSNVPDLWSVELLTDKVREEDELPDIGMISRSGVHDLNIHKANLAFLRQVTFVFLVEPSRLTTTAQIGLHLLMKNCAGDKEITYCSVDRNCDGLVDTLSHILMTNITEVSATEYPRGMSSYMCWTADSDYVQHRIIPGVSRYLGMGTELSMVALKNQVQRTVWYGGEAYPVLDAHWIAKQYYYDLLQYAGLPTVQETFDQCFRASFNMCDQRVSNYAYVTVEDERNNLFEVRRNFATIAEQQGFVNVISSEYMLREYMTENTQLFTADAKAIPYLTADFARTTRNTVLRLCLKLCIDGLAEEELRRELMLIGLDTSDPGKTLWDEICALFCGPTEPDRDGESRIFLAPSAAKPLVLRREDTLIFQRRYSMELGAFEGVYTIVNQAFADYILEDLQNATYIAEQDAIDCFLGTELKGHIYQKYLPGQFFTLNGKYYEMVTVTTGNRILVRRASEHIQGRPSYRQVRKYFMERIDNSERMGALKTINGIDIYYQYADFTVETPAYWKLNAYNDFESGTLVELNGVPTRRYYHKQILRLDFSKVGDAFTDSVKTTLTDLLNEVFVTLFADNQPYISAVTPGECGIPLTYSMACSDSIAPASKSISSLRTASWIWVC